LLKAVLNVQENHLRSAWQQGSVCDGL